MPTPVDCLIALGSNVGDRDAFLTRAVELLSTHERVDELRASQWHTTRPIGGPVGQGDFLNGAATFRTTLSPHKLLALLRDVEKQVGRQRVERWGPRVIDLDILLYGEQIISGNSADDLTIPHPRMAFRRFVLEPAAEVAAAMRHPVIGWTIADLLEHLRKSPSSIAIVSSDLPLTERLANEIAAIFLVNLQIIDKANLSDHNGPALNITGMSYEQAKTEIVAAIEAMRE